MTALSGSPSSSSSKDRSSRLDSGSISSRTGPANLRRANSVSTVDIKSGSSSSSSPVSSPAPRVKRNKVAVQNFHSGEDRPKIGFDQLPERDKPNPIGVLGDSDRPVVGHGHHARKAIWEFDAGKLFGTFAGDPKQNAQTRGEIADEWEGVPLINREWREHRFHFTFEPLVDPKSVGWGEVSVVKNEPPLAC